MTLILALDFETSGLFRKGLSPDDPSNPHIIQVGASLCDEDGHEGSHIESLVRPTDWSVEDEAAKVHGITTERARRVGLPIASVLRQLMAMVVEADLVIAHNMQFERRLIEVELQRLGAEGRWWSDVAKLCTMEMATPILKLPGKFEGEYKYPKLSEAHLFLFPEMLWDARHAALDDARAAYRVYRGLQAKEAVRDSAATASR